MQKKDSRLLWLMYEFKNEIFYKKWNKRPEAVSHYAYVTYRKRINGRKLISKADANNIIASAIINGTPFWAGRMGWNEMYATRLVFEHDLFPTKDYRKIAAHQLFIGPGFFPEEINSAEKYCHMVLDYAKDIDLQGFWDLYMEDYMLHVYQNTPYVTTLDALEPWNLYFESLYEKDCLDSKKERPWTYALKGKKVLVIHPFAELIKSQYESNREHIFERIGNAEDYLPEFELLTLKAVQTISGTKDERFETWFDAFNWMVSECKKLDFDVAIIGCGAYGYPLAAEIKRMGKIAIHLGGATQLLFGIKGKRWETSHSDIKEYIMNDYWTRQSVEGINDPSRIESSCYW